MVYFNLSADAPYSLDELSARLKADYGILMRPYDQRERKFRVVTHYWITPEHIERTVAALRALLLPAAQRERLAAD